ncbi:MAG: flagellar hook-length control protein FliK [Acidimicrobiales bacterium]
MPDGSGAGAPAVPEQMVTVLAPLRSDLGVHSVSLGLQPEGLGTVQATVSVDAQQVVVTLWAGTEAGHAALSGALPDLHDQLAASGHQVVVELASFGSAHADAHGAGRRGGRRSTRAATSAAVAGVAAAGPDGTDARAARTTRAASPSGLWTIDLRL